MEDRFIPVGNSGRMIQNENLCLKAFNTSRAEGFITYHHPPLNFFMFRSPECDPYNKTGISLRNSVVMHLNACRLHLLEFSRGIWSKQKLLSCHQPTLLHRPRNNSAHTRNIVNSINE